MLYCSFLVCDVCAELLPFFIIFPFSFLCLVWYFILSLRLLLLPCNNKNKTQSIIEWERSKIERSSRTRREVSVKWQETTKKDKVKQRVSLTASLAAFRVKLILFILLDTFRVDSEFSPYGYIIIRSVPILLCVFSIYWFRLVMVVVDESYFLIDNPLVTKVSAYQCFVKKSV